MRAFLTKHSKSALLWVLILMSILFIAGLITGNISPSFIMGVLAGYAYRKIEEATE